VAAVTPAGRGKMFTGELMLEYDTVSLSQTKLRLQSGVDQVLTKQQS
jgi:hypothetical protein